MIVKDLGKLQIQRHGGATGWQVGKQEYRFCTKCKSSSQAEQSAREKRTGRCDVTNTDQSPRPLPHAQKPLRSSVFASIRQRPRPDQHMSNLQAAWSPSRRVPRLATSDTLFALFGEGHLVAMARPGSVCDTTTRCLHAGVQYCRSHHVTNAGSSRMKRH